MCEWTVRVAGYGREVSMVLVMEWPYTKESTGWHTD